MTVTRFASCKLRLTSCTSRRPRLASCLVPHWVISDFAAFSYFHDRLLQDMHGVFHSGKPWLGLVGRGQAAACRAYLLPFVLGWGTQTLLLCFCPLGTVAEPGGGRWRRGWRWLWLAVRRVSSQHSILQQQRQQPCGRRLVN